MIHLTDEMLMAYADGELDPATRARVEILLKADPRASRRVEIFMATGAPMAKLFDAPLREPVPAHILATMTNSGTPRRTYVGHRSVSAGLLAAARNTFGGPRWANAAAWSILTVVLTGSIYLYAHRSSGTEELVAVRQGQMFAQGPLMNALETAPSGSKIALGNERSGAAMEALLSFKNVHQKFCRQYEVTTPVGANAGVACREDDGQWRVVIHAPVEERVARHDRIAPAGRSGSAIEAAVASSIEGDALGPADEEALIRNGWRQ